MHTNIFGIILISFKCKQTKYCSTAKMSTSPEKKKVKLQNLTLTNELKRPSDVPTTPTKRPKSHKPDTPIEKKILAVKRRNFIKACENVSFKAYSDHKTRFNLTYVPQCLNGPDCKHREPKNSASELQNYAEEAFKIEYKTNMWDDALEVCLMCITPKQYLTANMLKQIVEIMLNAHEDPEDNYTISDIINKCQQALSQNYIAHPPCLMKNTRKCYINFLTTPMDMKDNTFTNRTNFESHKGIVKYCMNRLEQELESESQDGPLVNKNANIPEEMKQSVKGLHWQKEKFEIFELLDRNERIARLLSVLDSIVELLQYDLAIWHSRHTTQQGRHMMRTHKPLMAFVLWSDNVLYTGSVNTQCRQIFRLFAEFVYLDFAEEDIDLMTKWLIATVEAFYLCESKSNSDYPNFGKYCTFFAKEFYKTLLVFPYKSILKILEATKPSYLQYLTGLQHLQTILATSEENILKILIDFLQQSKWKDFKESSEKLNVKVLVKPKKETNLLKTMAELNLEDCKRRNCNYPKLKPTDPETLVDQDYIIHVLYITLQAFMHAYNVIDIQEELESLNARINPENVIRAEEKKPNEYSYSVSDHFIKEYRSTYQMLQQLATLLNDLNSKNVLPSAFKVFACFGLLQL